MLSFVLERSEQSSGRRGGRQRRHRPDLCREVQSTPEDELLRYVIHGTLHLVGYDDATPRQRAAMRKRRAQVSSAALNCGRRRRQAEATQGERLSLQANSRVHYLRRAYHGASAAGAESQRDVDLLAGADHRDDDLLARLLGLDGGEEIVGRLDRLAVDGDDHVGGGPIDRLSRC